MADFLHYWIGHFQTQELFGEYMEEDYDVDVEEAPLSKFCAGQGEMFIDHDHMEMAYLSEADVIDDSFFGSYGDSFKADVFAAYRKLPVRKINCFITIYDDTAVENPRSVRGKGYWLEYMGKFPYRKKS